jgi:hypothetical protein
MIALYLSRAVPHLFAADLAVVLCTCRPDSPIPAPEPGYDLAPLGVGMQWIYRVDSTVFRPTTEGVDSTRLSFYWRERITDTLFGQAWLIERARGPSPEGPWEVVQTLSRRLDQNRLIQTEDNRAVIQLVFPARDGSCWDPTVLLDADQAVPVAGEPVQLFLNWAACIRRAAPPDSLAEQFPAPAYVLAELAAWESAIERRQVRYWFGQGIGLVQAQWQILDTQCQYCCQGDLAGCSALPWPRRAERGFRLTQTLISHS